MSDLFYIPIEKDESEYIQRDVLSMNELKDYHLSRFQNIINEFFIEDCAIVKLKTGKYFTKIFKPISSDADFFFCLVDEF